VQDFKVFLRIEGEAVMSRGTVQVATTTRQMTNLTAMTTRTAMVACLAAVTGTAAIAAEAVDLVRWQPSAETARSAAVMVPSAPLLTVGQILPLGPSLEPTAPDDQVREVFSRLESALKQGGSDWAHVARLNVYVAHHDVYRMVVSQLKSRFPAQKWPAVSVVLTSLPQPAVMVAVDAVAVSTRTPTAVELKTGSTGTSPASWSLAPAGSIVFVSGQAETADGTLAAATAATMTSLFKTLKFVDLSPAQVTHVKAFLTPMTSAAVAREQIRKAFEPGPCPPISFVEWVSTLPIEIELVATGPAVADRPVIEFLTPPDMTASPVFCRVTRVQSPQLIFTSGLLGSSAEPDSADEVRGMYGQLQSLMTTAGSDLTHLAKATYYVSNDAVSQRLNDVRPEFYDPQRPPAASKAVVAGTGTQGRTFTMDLIAVPKPSSTP
jgi:enamine deaminase RidA (YjgF/YER057c/UK114 family)